MDYIYRTFKRAISKCVANSWKLGVSSNAAMHGLEWIELHSNILKRGWAKGLIVYWGSHLKSKFFAWEIQNGKKNNIFFEEQNLLNCW